jgi:hypothetical protein
MSQEFTMQELVTLLDAKAVNGKVSLDDIAEIVFDAKFPEHLSKNAVEKLIEYSNDYKRYKELGSLLLPKTQEVLEHQKRIIELNNTHPTNDDDEDKIVNEIYELKLKQKQIEEEIKPLEDEFQNLHSFFKKIQEQK